MSAVNQTVNHVGIAVPDLKAAIQWYTTVLGFQKVLEVTVDRAMTPNAPTFRIYPKTCNKYKLATLTSGNGVGIELVEFIDPKMKHPAEFDFTRGGFYHLAITDPDPTTLVQKIIKTGGRQIGETVLPFDDGSVVCLYSQDPWGNTIEVLSCSWDILQAKTVAMIQASDRDHDI